MNEEKNRIVTFLFNKKRIPLYLFLTLGIIVGTIEYSFLSAILTFVILIVAGIVWGLIIRIFIK